MGKVIALVAKQRFTNSVMGANATKVYTSPEVVYINEDLMEVQPAYKLNGLTTVTEIDRAGGYNIYQVFQKPDEIEAQRNPATTDIMIKQVLQLALAGVGTTIASTLILKYLNEALTLGAGATDAGRLPTWVLNKVICTINNDASGDPFKIFPNLAGDQIDALGAGNAYSLAAGARVFHVAIAGNKWVTAVDKGR